MNRTIQIDWTTLKSKIDSGNYIYESVDMPTDQRKNIYARNGYLEFICSLLNPSSDLTDYQNNYEAGEVGTLLDAAGRPTSRQAITEPGWAYLAIFLEIKSATLSNSFRCKDFLGNDYPVTVKYFDDEYDGNELLNPTQLDLTTSCKRTEFLIDYERDFDIVQGQVSNNSLCATDHYLDVCNGMVSIGDAGVVPFIEGMNLAEWKYIQSNGRVGKRLNKEIAGAPGIPANVWKAYMRSATPGIQHKVSLVFEMYRDPYA